jgi:DNA-binding SARP family transcriptional activator
VAAKAVPALRIEVLGGYRVQVGAQVVPESAWRRSKAAGLVKLLTITPAHRLHREQLMDVLWPDLDPVAAAANLRKALHHARRALDAANGSDLIISAGDVLALPREGLWVDVDAMRAAGARARRGGEPSDYLEAVDLYGDGLLPDDRYEEWTFAPRDELAAEWMSLVEELVALLEARGELEAAIREAARLAAADPYREESAVLLMRLHALSGHRTEAVRAYERLRDLLASEGAEPGIDAQRLYEEIRSGMLSEPELNAELWERVGQMRMVAGDSRGAVSAFQQALGVADGAAAGRLHRQMAQAWVMVQDPEQAEPHIAAAEQLVSDAAEQGRLACLRANQAWERGDLERAEELAGQARSLALSAGTPDDVAAAEETQAIVSHMRGDWRRGLEIEISRQVGEDDRAASARVFEIHHCIAQYHLYGDGPLDGVETYARHALSTAEQASAVRAQAFAWCLLGESLLLQARWEEAGGCLERSCDLHASLGSRSGALPWQRLAELAICQGAPAEAAQPLRRASAIATVSPMAKHMWGRIYATAAFGQLTAGDPEAAARSIRSAGAAAARYGDCPTCSALLNPVATEVLVALGDRDGARPYADAAAAVARYFESAAWQAMAESAAGTVAYADGDGGAARARYAAAAGLYQRAGLSYWHERSLVQAAGA